MIWDTQKQAAAMASQLCCQIGLQGMQLPGEFLNSRAVHAMQCMVWQLPLNPTALAATLFSGCLPVDALCPAALQRLLPGTPCAGTSCAKHQTPLSGSACGSAAEHGGPPAQSSTAAHGDASTGKVACYTSQQGCCEFLKTDTACVIMRQRHAQSAACSQPQVADGLVQHHSVHVLHGTPTCFLCV